MFDLNPMKTVLLRVGNSLGFMINDDRFILGCLENWEFGVDDSGDLMKIQNLEKLKDRCKQIGDIELVTADGSIDCQVIISFCTPLVV